MRRAPQLGQKARRLQLNAQAVADDQHADHQFRIDRGLPGVAVVRLQVLAQVRQVEEVVDRAQQVVLRHQVVEVEGVKKRLLRFIVVAHHGEKLHP